MLSGLGLILSLNCKRRRSFREEEEDRSERASERLEEEMMEEGPPAPKMLRMVYFVGAGCKFALCCFIFFSILISIESNIPIKYKIFRSSMYIRDQ